MKDETLTKLQTQHLEEAIQKVLFSPVEGHQKVGYEYLLGLAEDNPDRVKTIAIKIRQVVDQEMGGNSKISQPLINKLYIHSHSTQAIRPTIRFASLATDLSYCK